MLHASTALRQCRDPGFRDRRRYRRLGQNRDLTATGAHRGLRGSRNDQREGKRATAGKNNLCIIAVIHAYLAPLSRAHRQRRQTVGVPRQTGAGWLRRREFSSEEKPENRAWAGGFVFANALPAMGIMAIGGWPKGFFTHQFRQFRVISAATQKCCSREMDRLTIVAVQKGPS